jgi:L-aspartate oxidase
VSEAPLCVIGAGVAGLSTAIAAAPRPVLLLSRGKDPLDCASALAQGGLAAALAPPDHPAQHAEDTLIAGAGRNRRDAVDWLTTSAPQAVAWLESLGIAFDRDANGYLLAREGGHRCHRVLHIGGDATGRELVTRLAGIAGRCAHITWKSDCDVEALGLANGRVAALRWRSRQGLEETPCAALVMAGGSLAACFADTTHPLGSDGAALALALRAGVRSRDLHYVQFHPTAMYAQAGGDGRMPLVTEALRGAGALLRDHRGSRFMTELHADAELAPRDVCARGVWQAQRRDGWAWLHAEHLRIEWERQFPSVLRSCLAAGIDPRRQPIPVGTAAHYQVGGIACDLDGRSSLPGLYAVGEIASSGVHGANRLASNSLLEAVLGGRRLGGHLATLAPTPRSSVDHWVERGAAAATAEVRSLRHLAQRCLGPLREPEEVRAGLQLVDPDGALGGTWQARLLGHLLRSALSDADPAGVHCWREHAASEAIASLSAAIA